MVLNILLELLMLLSFYNKVAISWAILGKLLVLLTYIVIVLLLL